MNKHWTYSSLEGGYFAMSTANRDVQGIIVSSVNVPKKAADGFIIHAFLEGKMEKMHCRI